MVANNGKWDGDPGRTEESRPIQRTIHQSANKAPQCESRACGVSANPEIRHTSHKMTHPIEAAADAVERELADLRAKLRAKLAVPADLAEAGRVLEGVTPGPWSVPGQPDKICAEGYTKNGAAKTVATVTMPGWMTAEEWSANARFIAWAREGVPALIATVTAQAARIEGLEKDRDKDHRFIKELCSQIEQLNAKVADWSVRAESAEARIAQLESDLGRFADANHRQAFCIHATAGALGPDYAATIDALPKAARHVRTRAEAAEARVKRLEDALRFYASESLWDYDGMPDSMTPMERDGGQVARAALKEEPTNE